MTSSTRQQDLFDTSANNPAYIDQVDSATDEEEDLLSNSDGDSLFDQLDDLRVEDEDWEIAERGLSFFLFSPLGTSPHMFYFFFQTLPNSTIGFGSTSPCDPNMTPRR